MGQYISSSGIYVKYALRMINNKRDRGLVDFRIIYLIEIQDRNQFEQGNDLIGQIYSLQVDRIKYDKVQFKKFTFNVNDC